MSDLDDDNLLELEVVSDRDAGADALLLSRRLAALLDVEMRRAALLRFLAEHRDAPDATVAALAEITRRGRDGGPPFGLALRALVDLLAAELVDYETQAALYAAARERDEQALMQLFYSGHVAAPPERRARDEEQRELTLGHRKTLARTTRDRERIQRYIGDPEASVVRELLLNRLVTEDDVVRIAAKRPTDPQVQREVFRSKRWLSPYRVKRTLVLNPYTPGEIALRLLAFLTKPDLRLVASSPTLSAQLRDAARSRLGS
ncbi:MAG: hypothetical protein KC503_40155 [Myxococcales bacterium]|nr:hypothetical protein [Myxococcales bacterium]